MITSRGLPATVVADPFSLSDEQRRRAARVVASKAHDAEDCGLLLAVLGLTPADGLPAVDEVPAQATKLLGRRQSTAQPRRR
jgi:hypothetical protein